MSSLLFLIPAALFLGLVGLVAFLWALRGGQFDDLEGAASRILFDDDQAAAEANDAAPPTARRPGEAVTSLSKQGDS